MSIQESGEMYLETILVLKKQKDPVRAVDVGEKLGYSKPSVSRGLAILKNDQLIIVEDSGNILFTPEGQKIAETIYERHLLLTNLLVSWGVDPAVAAEDACKIEHVISNESIEAIKKSGLKA